MLSRIDGKVMIKFLETLMKFKLLLDRNIDEKQIASKLTSYLKSI